YSTYVPPYLHGLDSPSLSVDLICVSGKNLVLLFFLSFPCRLELSRASATASPSFARMFCA
ncbi:MAG: hypothetical protein ACM3TN_22940, partial [Alphaproteobacteria bacterium]